jgi:hypothetical protein
MKGIELRNEFSVCRVYVSTGTLRSFDRRPLNHAVLHQQQQLVILPPAANTSNQQPQLAAVDVGVTNGRQTTETSHDSSSSGSRGMVVDYAAAIDWDSLMTPPAGDGLSFSADDLDPAAVWPLL